MCAGVLFQAIGQPVKAAVVLYPCNADLIKDLGVDRHPYGRADRRCIVVYPLYDPLL